MKLRLIILVTLACLVISFSASAYKQEAKTRLKKRTGYDNVIVLSSDGRVDQLSNFRLPDPDRYFLSERVGLEDEGAEDFLDASQDYFKEQFGIDFTQLPWVNGTKTIPGVASLEIRNFAPDVNYRAIYLNGRRVNLPLEAGGVFVTILGTDVVYGGAYGRAFGGETGVPAFPFDLLVAGYYRIDRGKRLPPVILQFRQGFSPTHLNFEGWNLFQNDIFSSHWGVGSSDGAAAALPAEDGNGYRSVIRNVITFPGRLADAQDDGN